MEQQHLAQQAARVAARMAEQAADLQAAAQWRTEPRKVAPWIARAQAGTLPPKVYR